MAAPAANYVLGGVLSDPLLTQKSKLSSFALVDTLSFAGDRLLLTAGARHQSIKDKGYDYTTGAETASYDRSAVTPFPAWYSSRCRTCRCMRTTSSR